LNKAKEERSPVYRQWLFCKFDESFSPRPAELWVCNVVRSILSEAEARSRARFQLPFLI
jgi:hypothetical protein